MLKKLISILLLICLSLSMFACESDNDFDFDDDDDYIETNEKSKDNSKETSKETSKPNKNNSKDEDSEDFHEESDDDFWEDDYSEDDFWEDDFWEDDYSEDDFWEDDYSQEESKQEQIDFGTDINALLNKEVAFKNGDFDKTLALFDGLIAEYPYQELYGIMDAYEDYLALPEYVSTHENYFADGEFTSQELYNITKSNNDANKNYETDDYVPDDELKYICEIMAPVILDYALNADEQECKLLSEKLENLQITNFSDFGFGYYSDYDNCLGVRIDLKGDPQYEHTIVHETQHLLQSGGRKWSESKNIFCNFGMQYRFTEEGDNPLALHVMSENCAEMLAHNWFKSRQYDVYEHSIVYHFELIKVPTILDKNIESDSFEKLSLSRRIEDLFDYFGCETQAEKEEVLNMLCAINYLSDYQSVGQYFRERYEEKTGKEYDGFIFMCEVYNALGQTLTKHFYRNLAEILENKTVTVEEVFTIMALYEHKLSNSMLISEPEDIKDALSLYQKSQTEFLQILSQKLGMSVEELQAAYDEFYTDAVLNASAISFLSQSEAEFLQYTTDTALNQRFRSINQYIIKNS